MCHGIYRYNMQRVEWLCETGILFWNPLIGECKSLRGGGGKNDSETSLFLIDPIDVASFDKISWAKWNFKCIASNWCEFLLIENGKIAWKQQN